MGVIAALRGRIECRYLAVFRLDPLAAASLLAPGERPLEYAGHTPLALSYTRLSGNPRAWVPRALDGTSDHLAWRVPITLGSGGPPRSPGANGESRAVRVHRRDTSSWLNARFAGALTRGTYRRSRFALERDEARVRLRVESDRGEEVLTLAAGRAPRLRGSMFATLRQAEEYLAGAGPVRPPDPLAPALDHLGVRGGHWAVEPMEVTELSAPALAADLGIPEEAAELDCVLELVFARRAGRFAPASLEALEAAACATS